MLERPAGLLVRARMWLRRLVVLTAVPPVSYLYAAVYRAHIWYAARRLSAIPGTRAIYVTRGAASNEVIYGVSDIDLMAIGEWPDGGQARVVKEMGRLAALSPIYDPTSTLQVHTPQSLRGMFEGDYFFQFRLDQARQCSRLVFGQDLLGALPSVPAMKLRGGYYMETRVWWMQFCTIAFGDGPACEDGVFCNSVAQKAVAAVLNMEAAMAGAEVEHSRLKSAEAGMKRLDAEEREIVERLQQCWRNRYLEYSGDAVNDALQVLLKCIEHIHTLLPAGDPFQPLPGKSLTIDAPPGEVFRSEAALAHARTAIDHAKRNWPGYRNAFLLPRSSFGGIDDLQLLIDIDPARPPDSDQIRALCRLPGSESLRQRVALYLLYPNGAYLLDRKTRLEFWHVLESPAANPEIFNLLSRPEYVADGEARVDVFYPWTLFAATVAANEMLLRQTAAAKAMAGGGAPNSLTMLRGVWRQLQLEVMKKSAATDTVYVPMTAGAILRGMRACGMPDLPILHELKEAYEQELEGKPSRALQLIPQAIALFSGSR